MIFNSLPYSLAHSNTQICFQNYKTFKQLEHKAAMKEMDVNNYSEKQSVQN